MNLVKRKLTGITVVIVLTSILGILSILEVRRGVSLHESNIQHLGLTAQLNESVHLFGQGEGNGVADVRKLMAEIRLEPQKCVDSMNAVLEFGLKLLGTEKILGICQDDFKLLNEGVLVLDSYENDEITKAEFKDRFYPITLGLHAHSIAFRPLVSKTVSVLLLIAGLVIALKGFLVTGITIHSSKSILRQYDKAVKMEKEIRVKNDALNHSIEELETQKLEISRAQQSAEHNAMHDSLTGLPNRRFLDNFLGKQLSNFSEITIFHIDMDGFKQVNDTKGHHAGDMVLQAVATRMLDIADGNDVVARIGGDEFILVTACNEGDECTDAETLAHRIVCTLNRPIMYNGHECRMSASVGVAIHNGSDVAKLEDYSTLLKNSDLALYRSKLNGRNGYAFYDATLHKQVTDRKAMGEEILVGLENNEFIPYFQLQVKSGTHEPAGVEALVRWQHPSKGLLYPDSFLSIAEDMGVLDKIDQQMFDQALVCFNHWKDIGIVVPRLSVNVSWKRLVEPNLIETLKQSNFTKGQLSFEILESVLLDDIDAGTKEAINALKEIGVELELDDFGSGHASMLGLIELQPDRFKIDRQLIRNIESIDSQRSLVQSIIEIGKTLDLEVVGEGVENNEQATILHALGCDILQGYHFSKPISNESFIELVGSKSWPKAA